jgi:adenylate kinase family enzyme
MQVIYTVKKRLLFVQSKFSANWLRLNVQLNRPVKKKRTFLTLDMDELLNPDFAWRVNVIGTSGCGKSTFSKKLSAIVGAPYIEIDKIFWGPEWSSVPDEEFFEKLEKELSIEKWVLDGNYTRTIPIKWKDVKLVIWLDYSFWRVFTRALRRALGRVITQVEIWEGTGNRESLKMLFSNDSIVLWTLKTYYKNRREYKKLMRGSKYAHVVFKRFSKPSEAEMFLKKVRDSMQEKIIG